LSAAMTTRLGRRHYSAITQPIAIRRR
jgi:hypothetical protein